MRSFLVTGLVSLVLAAPAAAGPVIVVDGPGAGAVVGVDLATGRVSPDLDGGDGRANRAVGADGAIQLAFIPDCDGPHLHGMLYGRRDPRPRACGWGRVVALSQASAVLLKLAEAFSAEQAAVVDASAAGSYDYHSAGVLLGQAVKALDRAVAALPAGGGPPRSRAAIERASKLDEQARTVAGSLVQGKSGGAARVAGPVRSALGATSDAVRALPAEARVRAGRKPPVWLQQSCSGTARADAARTAIHVVFRCRKAVVRYLVQAPKGRSIAGYDVDGRTSRGRFNGLDTLAVLPSHRLRAHATIVVDLRLDRPVPAGALVNVYSSPDGQSFDASQLTVE